MNCFRNFSDKINCVAAKIHFFCLQFEAHVLPLIILIIAYDLSIFGNPLKWLLEIFTINTCESSQPNHSILVTQLVNKSKRKMKLQLFILCCALQSIYGFNVSDYISKFATLLLLKLSSALTETHSFAREI